MSEDLQSFAATGRLIGNASVSYNNGETVVKFRMAHNADTKKTSHGTEDVTVIFNVEFRSQSAPSRISAAMGVEDITKTVSRLKNGVVVTVTGTLVPVMKGGRYPSISWKIKANRVSFPFGTPETTVSASRREPSSLPHRESASAPDSTVATPPRQKGRKNTSSVKPRKTKETVVNALAVADDMDRQDMPPPPPPGSEESRTWAWQDDDGIWWSHDKVWWYDRMALKWRAASDYVKVKPFRDEELPF